MTCVLIVFLIILSGCIRLQAGYFTQTPKERKEHTVGLDTGKLIENKQATGNITT